MKRSTTLRWLVFYPALLTLATIVLFLAWLRWDAHRPREEWFAARHGHVETAMVTERAAGDRQISESLQLKSDSGLQVGLRVLRPSTADERLPLLLILGGHRTGGDAVDLFGEAQDRAIVSMGYPYAGPDKVKGLLPVLKALPLARQAVLDTTPAISLVLDWLLEQSWVDSNRIILVGASLGVPFAASAAARDQRITAVMLVHGAANNRQWLKVQVARRLDAQFLHDPLATLLYWIAYGPTMDTANNIARIAPRPVLIIGARDDERTPIAQVTRLHELSGEPRRLRFTDGPHVQPGRTDVIADLLRIVDEEFSFLAP